MRARRPQQLENTKLKIICIMKNKAFLITGALSAIIGGEALAQSVVVIPAFQNRFASPHQPVVALNTVNRSSAFETRSFRDGTFPNPADRGVVTSPTAAASRGARLDPTVMNIPVFPGNPTVFAPGALPQGFGTFPPNAVGFSSGGVLLQQGSAGSTLQQVDPFRATATPGPAVNALPNPAVNAVPAPAAPVPTTPQIIPSQPVPGAPLPPGTTIPVPQQTPGTAVPGSASPAPSQSGGQQNR